MSFTKVFYNNDSFQDGALQMYRAFAIILINFLKFIRTALLYSWQVDDDGKRLDLVWFAGY